MTVTRENLRRLRAKYLEIRRLRAQDGGGDPTRDMIALSQQHPGALRELDRLSMDGIEARLAHLERALSGAEPIAFWMACSVEYHGWLRAALRIRRHGRGRPPGQVWEELQESYRPESDEPRLEAIGAGGVASILKPPGGRINAWVFARVGARLGRSPDVIEHTIFAPGTETEPPHCA